MRRRGSLPGRSISGSQHESEVVGRFEVLAVLREGGMGTVYLARDPELDRKVAVKVLRGGGDPRADGEQRLRREALALAKLAHPNVVTVYEVGTDDFGSLLIAMEYVPARTLRTLLEEDELDLRANIQLHVGRWLRLAPCLSTGFRTRQDEAVITRNSADKI